MRKKASARKSSKKSSAKSSRRSDTPRPTEKTKAKTDKQIVNSLRQVSLHFGVRYDTVRKSWRDAGMPVMEDGRYDLHAIAEWRKLRDAGRESGNGSAALHPTVLERRELDNQIRRQQIIQYERQNAIAAGGLVSLDRADRVLSAMLTWLRDEMSRVPEDMETEFPENLRDELKGSLRRRLERILKTLQRQKEMFEELARDS